MLTRPWAPQEGRIAGASLRDSGAFSAKRRFLVSALVWASMLGAGVPGRALDGTFNVTEDWKVTLSYSHWGDQDYSGTKTVSGTQTGKIIMTNGRYQLVDKAGIPGGAPADEAGRVLSATSSGYSISGGKVMPALAAGSSLYGLVYLGAFIVKVPIIDGEIPTFTGYTPYGADGDTLQALAGFGDMRGFDLDVTVESTIAFVLAPSPPVFLQQPSDQTVISGGEARFTTLVGGNPAPALQWQRKAKGSKSWANLADGPTYVGVKTGTLEVLGTTVTMSGDQFRCVASNSSAVTSDAATLVVEAPPPVWVESWEHAAARPYVVTDTTYDGIMGDGANWIVTDGADVCSSNPHPAAAEVVSVPGSKILRLVAPDNDCTQDLSVTSGSVFSIPILTNSILSIVEIGVLDNPSWNGAFPTFFPPPGDHVHLILTDQNGNRVIYLFQRAPNYPAHTDSVPVELPDGHVAAAGYREVFLGEPGATGGFYARNLYADFSGSPEFNPSGAKVIQIEFAISGVGGASFDDLKIGTGLPLPPQILAPPADQTVTEMQNATLQVVATGEPPLNYRWQRRLENQAEWQDLPDGDGFPGAATPTLTVVSVPLSMDGAAFRCVVSNLVAVVASSPAVLSVVPKPSAPVFLLQPVARAVVEGASAEFSVTARSTGAPAPLLVWQRKAAAHETWEDLSASAEFSISYSTAADATASSTLSVVHPTLAMDGDQFRCVATNPVGPTSGEGATLTVGVGPAIGFQPFGVTLAEGNSASISVEGTGTPPLTFEWRKGDQLLASGDSPALELTNVHADDAGTYSVWVTNAFGAIQGGKLSLTVIRPFTFTTWVGVPFYGSTDGSGDAARFLFPSALATDSEGHIYVADEGNQVLRKISPSGVVTTIAGAVGIEGSTDGPGVSARFSSPRGVAVDAAGTIYVADFGNNTVRRVLPDGSVTTLAGSPGITGSSDGPAGSALFNHPRGVAVDATGNVYVTDSSHTIRRIAPTGEVSTLAGAPGEPGSVDDVGRLPAFVSLPALPSTPTGSCMSPTREIT